MLSGKPEINSEEDYKKVNIIFVITSYERLVLQ